MFPQPHGCVGLRTNVGQVGHIDREDRGNRRQDVEAILLGKESAETGLRESSQRLGCRIRQGK